MRTLTIQRLEAGASGTFGVAYDDRGYWHAVTLERDWVDADADGHRDRDVSRIPAGEYIAYRRAAATTRHGYDLYELLDVPDTDHAQIHIANVVAELRGCIAVGTRRGLLYPERPAVLDSHTAFEAMMSEFRDDRIRVVVRDIEAPRP